MTCPVFPSQPTAIFTYLPATTGCCLLQRLQLRHEYDVIITSVWQKRFRRTYTAFTLTRFGSVISSGTVTKRSVNRAEPCRTEPGWDLLTEPGQHGSVRLFGKCEHLYNRANCF